jgi:hypothetical protein
MNEMHERLLAGDEPEPVTVRNADGPSPFLIVADRAGNLMPRALGRLGVTAIRARAPHRLGHRVFAGRFEMISPDDAPARSEAAWVLPSLDRPRDAIRISRARFVSGWSPKGRTFFGRRQCLRPRCSAPPGGLLFSAGSIGSFAGPGEFDRLTRRRGDENYVHWSRRFSRAETSVWLGLVVQKTPPRISSVYRTRSVRRPFNEEPSRPKSVFIVRLSCKPGRLSECDLPIDEPRSTQLVLTSALIRGGVLSFRGSRHSGRLCLRSPGEVADKMIAMLK